VDQVDLELKTVLLLLFAIVSLSLPPRKDVWRRDGSQRKKEVYACIA